VSAVRGRGGHKDGGSPVLGKGISGMIALWHGKEVGGPGTGVEVGRRGPRACMSEEGNDGIDHKMEREEAKATHGFGRSVPPGEGFTGLALRRGAQPPCCTNGL
jgi:hypothetical protein